jgi:hypothetical protein
MTATSRRARTDAAPNQDNWRSYGACKNDDPDLFFPIGQGGPARLQVEQAKQVCWRCPGKMLASEHVLTYQLAQFLRLRAEGRTPLQIASALRTNVQTVNSVVRKLEQRTAPQVVKTA